VLQFSHSSVPDAGSDLVSRTDKETHDYYKASEVVSVVTIQQCGVHMRDESEQSNSIGDDLVLDDKMGAGAEDERRGDPNGSLQFVFSSEICLGRRRVPWTLLMPAERCCGCGALVLLQRNGKGYVEVSSTLLSSEDVVETDWESFEGLTHDI
jgi:hypothetical protein